MCISTRSKTIWGSLMTARNNLWIALFFIIAITLPACKTTKDTKGIANSTTIDDVAVSTDEATDDTAEQIDEPTNDIAGNTDETIGDTAERIDESINNITGNSGEATVLIWDELDWDGNEWE